jgi:hypothetical protein
MTRDRLSEPRLALVLGLLALLVYNANFRVVGGGDSYPARFLPFALWNHGTLYLDPVRDAARQRKAAPYWIYSTPDGHQASLYPLVTPLLAAPVFLPGALWLRWAGETYDRTSWLGEILEKLSASLIAAAAVGWMYLLLRRRLERRDAVGLTLAFAFATSTWSTGSQALWQHGTAELLIVGTLWFITREPATGNVLAAGALTGLIAANRPADLPLAVAFAIYSLVWARRRAAGFAAAAAVPCLLTLLYNLSTFHHVAGGYFTMATPEFFAHSALTGVAGLLVSPGRGLFVYAPLFLFLPVLFRRVLAERETRMLALCLASGIGLQILLYARTDWRAGSSYGYRFLTDLVPILIWMLAPVLASLGRPARVAFLACCLLGLWAQGVGAFFYSGTSERALNDPADMEMRNVWKIENAPLLVESRNWHVPFSRLRKTMGLWSGPR